MTKLDSILKSRDITLPTKFHILKVMVFLVAMYGCESWTINKAEYYLACSQVLGRLLEKTTAKVGPAGLRGTLEQEINRDSGIEKLG